jgi:carboxymethylenebutenolidase
MTTGTTRRQLLGAAAAAPLATLLASPTLTAVAAASATDVSIKTEGMDLAVSASLALPDVTPAPAVILIHEFWGLNDQIKAVGAQLAKAGYIALSIDMYGGQVATDRDTAMSLMTAVDENAGVDTVRSWVNWLKQHPACSGKVASMGWCFGGGWSLETAIESSVDASIIYYGRVNAPLERIQKVEAPVLGHFATLDAFINEPMVKGFEDNMAKAGKDLTVHWYEADHAFANPTSARYDDEDAALSWERSMAFLNQHLGG